MTGVQTCALPISESEGFTVDTDLVTRQTLLIQQLSTRIHDLEEINTNLREHVKALIAESEGFGASRGRYQRKSVLAEW